MPLEIIPEIGIPVPKDTTPEDLTDFREKAHALLATMEEYTAFGATVQIQEEDKEQSHEIFNEKKYPPVNQIRHGAIINLNAILSQWDEEILDSSTRIRTYVTNKLLYESTSSDARTRMKALELLGKLSGVGLFSDKVEVNVTHRSLTDIEAEIKKTLAIYGVKQSVTEDVQFNEVDDGHED